MRKIAGLTFLIALSACNSNDPITFNSAAWKNGDRYLRGRMVDDLLRDSLLIGKTRKEVTDLLGSVGENASDSAWTYYTNNGDTGPLGLGGPWMFALQIDFDSASGLVKSVRYYD